MEHRIPRFTLEGVKDADVSVHPFSTEDELGLKLTRFRRDGHDGDVVLLVHGLTSSSDIFVMPEIRNMASFLLDNGFGDVWALDFRMSSHFPYDVETRDDSLDDIALYDHPAALAEIRRHVGADRRIHVIAHCLGSLSFTMALFAGTTGPIASLVCNSVALTPRVPRWSRLKLAFGATVFEYLMGLPYIDPRFHHAPPLTRRWLFARAVSLFHPECREPACHMQSFMWGSGRPAMYVHANLARETHTHERLADLNGASGVHYYRHIRKMVAAGRAVRRDPGDPRHAALPDDYLSRARGVDTPILLLTGDRNRVFTDSNIVMHRLLEKAAPGRHELQVLPAYGHIDPIIGKNAHADVYPLIIDFLKRQAG
ncbi:cholesterol oxidase [Thermocatellispora tengchongensis]|uniref:Cholesterol oxidase n=1 Tax=Thermocatellispora tengchongensis TaxID=1073253 RepID=A0A840P4L5_9ACTN|nr:alpha/beta fold hydrolase [Thermocatellispora tengchongensis]MBB5134302.1 cholesterol oxidase [Thermocatellispora tengchongensis]